MPVHDLFSKRNRPRPERLVHDTLPSDFRSACARIFQEALGNSFGLLSEMDAILRREHPSNSNPLLALGVALADPKTTVFGTSRLAGAYLSSGTFHEAMDAIEVTTRSINLRMRKLSKTRRQALKAVLDPDDALAEVNSRFVEHGVGYQFSSEQNRIVRIDSQFVQQEVTAPAMRLLTEKGFEGAAQEFDKAHQHYRQMVVDPDAGKDAVAWAVKAVESTTKTIMDARGWDYNAQKDTLVPLLEKLFTNGLVPTDLQSYFCGLRSALTSGLPTIANRQARHGQGAKVKPIEEHMVTLAMHLAAATIRFLVEAHKAK